jgi:YD repeat-containing protein
MIISNKEKTTWKILLCMQLFLLICPSFGQRLKGKVKSYKDSYYAVQEQYGKIKPGARLNDPDFHDEELFFDNNGNVTQSVEYNSDGTIYCKYKGRYDYVDNHIESIYVSFDPDIKVQRKPFILESLRYSWGEICKMTYKIDFKVRPVEETIYDLMGRVIFTIRIKRDENGNPLVDSFSDGTVDRYKYDNKGNRIEWVSVSPGGNTTIVTNKFDEFGNIIEKNINNFFKSTYKFHYDCFTYKYQYDNQGNWVERTEYDNDKPQKIIVRKIEYAL